MANINYSSAELMDMVLIYGESQQNAARACRIYRNRFPGRNQPVPRTIVRAVQRGRDTGSVMSQQGSSGGPRRHLLDEEEAILDLVQENPSTSTRLIARQLNVSQSFVSQVLRTEELHPYHIQRVQALQEEDFPRRVEFCEWLIRQDRVNPNFTSDVLATDESCFTRNGIMNFHNTHIWSVENPHAFRRVHCQQQFSVNVWAGIVNNQLLGPCFLPPRLNGPLYLNFLQNDLIDLIDDVPLAVLPRMWYLHDGAPPHFFREVRDHLNNVFPYRWIGRGGPVAWPPRSPDLNPMDFYFWSHLKSLVYQTEAENVEDLMNRIVGAGNLIRQQPNIFQNVMRNWVRRAQLCVEVGGRNFEHLL